MAFHPDERIALFIDGANLYSSGKLLNVDFDYKKILTYFQSKGRFIRAYYYTAVFERDDYSALRPLIDWLDFNGYHVITKPAKEQTDRNGRKHIKGNMDIDMAVDMLDHIGAIDHMVLFTGDGDFCAALKAVQKKGMRVTVVSTQKSSPSMVADELRRQADNFIELMDLIDETSREDSA